MRLWCDFACFLARPPLSSNGVCVDRLLPPLSMLVLFLPRTIVMCESKVMRCQFLLLYPASVQSLCFLTDQIWTLACNALSLHMCSLTVSRPFSLLLRWSLLVAPCTSPLSARTPRRGHVYIVRVAWHTPSCRDDSEPLTGWDLSCRLPVPHSLKELTFGLLSKTLRPLFRGLQTFVLGVIRLLSQRVGSALLVSCSRQSDMLKRGPRKSRQGLSKKTYKVPGP
ncbi:hypothetical protein BCV70DRAFT_59981 [Testicularia cyperi]|uniref:Uncharacterized protein n=1 Tax=Testicularia cyperi TaxID=1882483 RepID=A0A317XWN2_9BASI|nr:hypothetical protein BCV70DRAFT_59981 [Testicularia cyperi]